MVVDIGALEEEPTDTLPGFTERLLALLPGLVDHQCSRGRDGGFVERLVEGTWAGHVSEHVALELQRTAGQEITRGKTRSTGARGVYNVIYGFLDETVGDDGRSARGPAGQPPGRRQTTPDGLDFAAEHETFLRTSQRVAFGPSTQAILEEAIARDIPWQRLNSGVAGAARARRPPAAHPGHHDLADGLAGGGHRLRQGADQSAAGRRRAAGARVRGGAQRRRRRPDGAPDRLSRRAQAAGRQPRARRRDQPDYRGRGRARRSPRPTTSPAAATCWSSRSSPARTTGCWWSAGTWSRSPSGCRRT